jgi:predicted PurR-regulated permease PerM
MRTGLSLYDWQHAVIVLAATVLGVTVVASLYWAQAIFIPLALAVFLTFILSPPVARLERSGIRRTPAVIVVVLSTTLVLGGTGWIVTRQLVELVQELPKFSGNIKSKIKSLREMTEGSATNRLTRMADEISEELRWNPIDRGHSAEMKASAERAPATQPQAIVLQSETPVWIGRLAAVVGSLTESLASFALAVVLVIFILVKRESLRNRLIRLMGQGRMTATTKAVDDAGQRISRFLLMQLVVNGTYGMTMAIGLFLVGVEYALLWGFLAAALRYIPYIGAWIAAVPPLILSLAMYQGWAQPLMVVGIVLLMELITSNVIEPRLYGQSIGVSEVALLVAAAFWTFLWGPIGLVLSSPLTVCLVVLGKYVPQLEFFDVLLGDEPALEPHVSFYQRLLARDQDEATRIVLTQAETQPLEVVYDQFLLPALSYAKRDREHDALTDSDEQFIMRAISEIVEDLDEPIVRPEAETIPTSASERDDVIPAVKGFVLACPARDANDQLASEMLRRLLDPAKWDVQVVPVDTLAAEFIELAAQRPDGIVCVGSLPPGGLAHTRYLCKRLRAHLPDVKILVGRWGFKGNVQQAQEKLRQAGADHVETTLAETRKHLAAWLPVLAQVNGERQGTFANK